MKDPHTTRRCLSLQLSNVYFNANVAAAHHIDEIIFSCAVVPLKVSQRLLATTAAGASEKTQPSREALPSSTSPPSLSSKRKSSNASSSGQHVLSSMTSVVRSVAVATSSYDTIQRKTAAISDIVHINRPEAQKPRNTVGSTESCPAPEFVSFGNFFSFSAEVEYKMDFTTFDVFARDADFSASAPSLVISICGQSSLRKDPLLSGASSPHSRLQFPLTCAAVLLPLTASLLQPNTGEPLRVHFAKEPSKSTVSGSHSASTLQVPELTDTVAVCSIQWSDRLMPSRKMKKQSPHTDVFYEREDAFDTVGLRRTVSSSSARSSSMHAHGHHVDPSSPPAQPRCPFVILEGEASRASKTTRMAMGVQEKARKLLGLVKSAFETSTSSSDDGGDDDGIRKGEPLSATLCGGQTRPVDGDKDRAWCVVAEGRESLQSALPMIVWPEDLPDAPAAGTLSRRFKDVALRSVIVVWECWDDVSFRQLETSLMPKASEHSSAVSAFPRSLFIAVDGKGNLRSSIERIANFLVRCCDEAVNSRASDDESRDAGTNATVLWRTLWFVASDRTTSQVLTLLRQLCTTTCTPRQRQALSFTSIACLSPPSVNLGFDDLPRALARCHGVTTLPPRLGQAEGLLNRLVAAVGRSASILTSLLIEPKAAPEISFPIFPITTAEVTRLATPALSTSLYFAKSLHVLCTGGMEVTYTTWSHSSGNNNSSTTAAALPDDGGDGAPSTLSPTQFGRMHRKSVSMKRDPVLVGLYRCPCQGHFEFQPTPSALATSPIASFPLRMWTTRKHEEGLTAERHSIAPKIMCTSVYGVEVLAVTMKAKKGEVLYVYSDAERVPTFVLDPKGSGDFVPVDLSSGTGSPSQSVACVSATTVTIRNAMERDGGLYVTPVAAWTR